MDNGLDYASILLRIADLDSKMLRERLEKLEAERSIIIDLLRMAVRREKLKGPKKQKRP